MTRPAICGYTDPLPSVPEQTRQPQKPQEMSDTTRDRQSFEEAVEEGRGGGLIGDFYGFMKENAKWWLLPILFVFAMLGILLVLAGTGAAPFIYTLF